MKGKAIIYLLPAGLYFVLSLFSLPREAQQIKKEVSLYYSLQSVSLSKESHIQIERFIKRQKRGSYYLIQGFACRTGGFSVSRQAAKLRAVYLGDFLQKKGLPIKYLRIAPGIVYHEVPRKEYRRMDLKAFGSKEAWQKAYQRAETKARTINKRSKQVLSQSLSDIRLEKKNRAKQELYFILTLLLFLLALRGLAPTLAYLKREKHRLRRKDAQLLQFLTQGRLIPLPGPSRRLLPLRSVKAFLESDKSLSYMAKKNKSTKQKTQKSSQVTALPGIAKPFADKSLKILCKSPVHALTGLTPRHSQLLHEAFGIKTVEDLARLKYVEVAKAIAILAHYEK